MRRANTFDRLSKISYLCVVASFLTLAGCGGSSSSQPPPPPPEVSSVVVSPLSAQVSTGQTQLFTAQVAGTGAYNSAVTWSVNGAVGGNSTVGTISSSGQYTAPTIVPNPNNVMIIATSVQTPGVSGDATANVFAPAVLASITPTSASAGQTVVLQIENGYDTLSAVFPGVGGSSISVPLTQEWGNNFTITVPFGAVSGNVYVNITTLQGGNISTNSLPFTRLPNLMLRAANKDEHAPA
jgi:hypothetical protein